jgi:hypothetical protein
MKGPLLMESGPTEVHKVKLTRKARNHPENLRWSGTEKVRKLPRACILVKADEGTECESQL